MSVHHTSLRLEIANSIIHGIGIIFGIAALPVLSAIAANKDHSIAVVGAAIFGQGMPGQNPVDIQSNACRIQRGALILDGRGDRQGFAVQAMEELLLLHAVHFQSASPNRP